MKVFLSWSGDFSLKIACVFRDWLPSVIQSIKPYVSSEDIDKGSRWSTDIAKELEASSYGILCITKGNIDAPWINFEAGALSKTIDKSFVTPFLFDVKRSEVQGPLLQFQSTIFEKDDIFKLVFSINECLSEGDRLEEIALRKAFDMWWPELKDRLEALAKAKPEKKDSPKEEQKRDEAILEELLELARNQQRILRSPENLLPAGYLEQIFGQVPSKRVDQQRIHDQRLEHLHDEIIQIESAFREMPKTGEPAIKDVEEKVSKMHEEIHRLRRPYSSKSGRVRRSQLPAEKEGDESA
jgi:hypothetical protein